MVFDGCAPLIIEVALPCINLSHLPVKMQRNFNTVILLESHYPRKSAFYGKVFKCLCLSTGDKLYSNITIMTVAQEREVKESFRLFIYLKTFQALPNLIPTAHVIQN